MAERINIGDQVVCIDPAYNFRQDKWGNTWPIFAMVYTVRGFCHCPPLIGYWFDEIENQPRTCEPDGRIGEIAFSSKHFRLVKKTDIEVFKSSGSIKERA